MEIQVFINKSAKNVVNKELTYVDTLKGKCNMNVDNLNPVIRVRSDVFNNANYCYIKELGRYYFVDHIDYMKYKYCEVYLAVDVLKTYQKLIEASTGYVTDSDNYNKYINDNYVTECRTETRLQNFTIDLNSNGSVLMVV